MEVGGGGIDPAEKGCKDGGVVLRAFARTRFIGQFPRHDGRVVTIFPPGEGVGAIEDHRHILPEEILCRLVGVEGTLQPVPLLPWEVSQSPGWLMGRPRQVLRDAAGPIPVVVQEHHQFHLPFPRLADDKVEALQHIFVVFARPKSDGRLGRHRHCAILGRAQNPEVVDADRAQAIQLSHHARSPRGIQRPAEKGAIP